jgi:hypothetical protein
VKFLGEFVNISISETVPVYRGQTPYMWRLEVRKMLTLIDSI